MAASPSTGTTSQGRHKASSRGLSVTLGAVRGVQVDHLQLRQAAATAALLPDDSHLERKGRSKHWGTACPQTRCASSQGGGVPSRHLPKESEDLLYPRVGGTDSFPSSLRPKDLPYPSAQVPRGPTLGAALPRGGSEDIPPATAPSTTLHLPGEAGQPRLGSERCLMGLSGTPGGHHLPQTEGMTQMTPFSKRWAFGTNPQPKPACVASHCFVPSCTWASSPVS